MFRRALIVLACFGIIACLIHPAGAAEPRKTAHAWTFDEAVEQLRLNPEDVYLQYVALQLARNEGKTDEANRLIDELLNAPRLAAARRTARSICSTCSPGRWPCRRACNSTPCAATRPGEAASMADPGQKHGQNRRPARARRSRAIPGARCSPRRPIARQEARGRRRWLSACPRISTIVALPLADASCWTSIDAGDLWGTHLFTQAAKSAKTQRTSERLKTQLAIQTDPLTRPFYDMVVEEVAITGSDLFFREGSDVTMLFPVKQPEVFKLPHGRLSGRGREVAARRRPHAPARSATSTTCQVSTPDRAIHVFSAYPKPNLHVRSNSKAALERVLKAIAGDKDVPRLGEATEFKYIRTLMLRGDKREDGLIYLSDPFIRRLVGPELKLTEAPADALLQPPADDRPRGDALSHAVRQAAGVARRTGRDRLRPAAFFTASTAARRPIGSSAAPAAASIRSRPTALTGVCSHHGHAARTGALLRDSAGARDRAGGQGVQAVRRAVQPILAAVLRSDRDPPAGHAQAVSGGNDHPAADRQLDLHRHGDGAGRRAGTARRPARAQARTSSAWPCG